MFVARELTSRLGTAALIASAFVAQAALAEAKAPAAGAPAETVTRTVDLRGYDLSSPAGAQRALAGIHDAAESVCGSRWGSYAGVAAAVRRREQVQRCIDQAVTDALTEINARTGVDIAQTAKSADLVAER
ncbi:MAG TPA: UrcA family protein [Gammaproteobacteria bacterium]